VTKAVINKVITILGKLFHVKTLIILGALFLMASAFLGWIDEPVMRWIRGNKIQIKDNLPLVISYGSLCFLAGLFSFIALFRRFTWVSVITGIVGLMLSLNFFLTFCLFDSKRIIAINDLNQQEASILTFNKYLPPNFGISPTFEDSIAVDTILDRFYATFHFATFGWYLAILGSILQLVAFLKFRTIRNIKKFSFFLFLIFIMFYLSVALPPYIAAEYHRNKGDYYLATGMYNKAIEQYELAKRLDYNIAYANNFHTNVGKAYFFMGRTDKADYYLYRADIFIGEGNFPMALFFLKNAQLIEPSISKTVGNSLISWAYVSFGLLEYKKGMFASAIESWKKALETDPSQVQAYYYLSRAYYDISAYEESIMAGLQFLKLSGDEIMEANVSSNIADSYYRTKNYGLARVYYLNSLRLNMEGNQRAFMSVLGR
jgi:hypothetical protein